MAEAIGIAASVLQLVNTVRDLRIMVKAVRDVPRDLKNTLDDIENFEQIIAPIITSIEAVSPNTSNEPTVAVVSGQNASHALRATNARYEEATSAVKALTDHLLKQMNRKSHFKTLYQLKAAFKKEELTELRGMMESARSSLDLAISCYNTALIMAQLENLRLSFSKQEAALAAITRASAAGRDSMCIETTGTKRRAVRYPRPYQKELCGLRGCHCDCHRAISLQPWFWPLKLSASSSWRPCSKVSCRNSKNASVWISFTQIGIRLAVSLSLDLMFTSQTSYIRPSLSMQRVVRRTSPGFKILFELRWRVRTDLDKANQDLIELFETGKASPRDVDPDGLTWLDKLLAVPWYHFGITPQFSMLHMLAQMGTQINTSTLLYNSAHWIGDGPHLDLLDNLFRLQFDVSEIEPPSAALLPKPRLSVPLGAFHGLIPDPFFVEWISKNLEVCPGFSAVNPLMEAILIDTKDQVSRLLHKFPIDDQENLLGVSILHLAVFRPQHLEIILQSGADVNARDRNGVTPLMYASAVGQSAIALKLLEAGADPTLKDTIGEWDFLKYASEAEQWDTILEIMKCLRDMSDFSKTSLQSLLSDALIAWFHSNPYFRDRKVVFEFLEWGANPNVIFDLDGLYQSQTVGHYVKDIYELRTLISKGFTKFNHMDSTGSHALLSLAQEMGRGARPDTLEALIDGGSAVNLQNNNGHTSLHAVAHSLNNNFEWRYSYDNITQSVKYIEVLLRRGADPLADDRCDCYCSQSGCTPSHVLLKTTRHHVLALEYLDILRTTTNSETTRHCILNMLRGFKFEELEMTHTCCGTIRYSPLGKTTFEDDEIREIMEEEEDLAELLDQEMQVVESSICDDYDEAIISAILRTPYSDEAGESYQDMVSKPYFPQGSLIVRTDHWRDKFFVGREPDTGTPLKRGFWTILTHYAGWVEHEHSENQNSGNPDDEWYEKRRGWIAKLEEGARIKWQANRKQEREAE